MGISSSKPVLLTCITCAKVFSSTIWIILDAQEHPAEVTRMRQGEFNRAACPSCGTINAAQTALLFHASQNQMVIAMLPPSLEPYQGKEQTQELFSLLLAQLSPEELQPYLNQVRVVQDITDLLHLLDKATRQSDKTNRLTTNEKKTPASPDASVDAFSSPPLPPQNRNNVMRNTNGIAEAIQTLLMANTIDEFRGIVRRYPLLLQPETDQVLHQFIELALGERDVVLAEGLKHARKMMAPMRGELALDDQTLPPRPPLATGPNIPVTDFAGDTYHGDQELVTAYWALLQARTWDELRNAVDAHPLLFGATIDEVVEQWVDPILVDGYERLALLLVHRGERLEEVQQRIEKGIDDGETYSTL